MLGNLLFCSMVGYALAKMDFAGKRVLFLLVMVTLMVPGVVTFVPLFVLVSKLGLVNTYPALILPFLVSPLGVFLMRQFMMGIPDSLIEAARIDGAGELRIFTRVVMPLCGPPLATLGILTFLGSWNNFLWPLVAAQSEDKYTLPVALSLFSTGAERHRLRPAAGRLGPGHRPHRGAVRRRCSGSSSRAWPRPASSKPPLGFLAHTPDETGVSRHAAQTTGGVSPTCVCMTEPGQDRADMHQAPFALAQKGKHFFIKFPRKPMSYSIQLFTLRNAMQADLPGTIRKVAGIGFTQVEPYDFVATAKELGAALAENGLSAPSGHAPLMSQDQDEIFEAAKELGIATVIDPFLPAEHWQKAEDIQATAEKLNAVAKKGAAYGIRVGYHNHQWELESMIEGQTALEYFTGLLDPEVVLEVDTYWAAVGGQDPEALLRRLGDRVKFIHIKDGPINADIKAQQPAGQGRIAVLDVIAAARSLEVGVVEFDDYAGDIFDGITQSLRYLEHAAVNAGEPA